MLMVRYLLGLALFIAVAPVAGACSKSVAPVVAGLRISQPLVATPSGDDALVLNVGNDGCVRVHYPAWDTRAGNYRFALPAAELAKLRGELAASGIAAFQPAAVRADLAQREARKSAAAPKHFVSDEEVIELQVERPPGDAKGGAVRLIWTGLRQQRLNHPDQPDLAALEATRARLLELGGDSRMQRTED